MKKLLWGLDVAVGSGKGQRARRGRDVSNSSRARVEGNETIHLDEQLFLHSELIEYEMSAFNWKLISGAFYLMIYIYE